MKCFVVLLNFAILLIARITADDLSCPFNAKGTHPKCICNNDNPYDEVNRICATVLDAQFLLAKCPKGSEGTFPACICGDGKVYVPERDECVVVDTSLCPIGAKKVNNKCVCDNVNEFKYEFDEIFWICRPWYLPTTHAPRTCPSHQHMVDGICEWDHCPTGYTGSYWPDCTLPPTCQQKGMIGEWPNCHARVVEHSCGLHQTGRYPDCHWVECPDTYFSKTGYWPDCLAPPSCYDVGMTGVYPDCIKPPPPCPPHHHRNKDGECVRIPCPPGHEGDYQPNCKHVPKCPPEYPGKWPRCNIYGTTPSSHKTTSTTPGTVTTTPGRVTTTPGRVTTTPGTVTTTPGTVTTTPGTVTTTPGTVTTTPGRVTTTPGTVTTTPASVTTTPGRVTTTPGTVTTTPGSVTTTPGRVTTTPGTVTTTPGTVTTTPGRVTTTPGTVTTTPGRVTTTPVTPTKPGKCFCECYSDEIVIFKDNVVRDPSRKYKRFTNERHSNRN